MTDQSADLNLLYFDQNNLLLAAFEIDNAALDSSQYVNEGGSEGSGVYMIPPGKLFFVFTGCRW